MPQQKLADSALTPPRLDSPPIQPLERLLKFDETPSWFEGNQFILTGYRHESRSAILCLHSWTYLHNESCNIYSHLLPAVAYAALHWCLVNIYLPSRYNTLSKGDGLILSLFLSTVVLCLGASSLYHTFLNHSAPIAKRWLLCDYMGIITLIQGCFISGIYFGFYCEPYLQRVYWTMIVVLGSLTATILLSSKFQDQKWRGFRVAVFVCTGLSAFAPITHALFLYGLKRSMNVGLPYYLTEGAIIAFAAFIYERQVPERWFPGKFDIWGHSHTIFHSMVALGMCVHFVGLLEALEYTYYNSQCTLR
ncbi:hypothetical protein H109_01082 [Trichophyton interdigitale MR816]|uniref:Hemolysin-III channel protein Izh2 n=1 Tax=Trichophyton interdigitale (strain MR816) TaxID=1215338 RepID=A0A059JH59_TRIIM|nr:hypothetical protein H101_01090 [Trichophyton interdigitale H6]KDB27134.1 hypothetical protein H109_01082 [Trichophyton interdigitale MR816]